MRYQKDLLVVGGFYHIYNKATGDEKLFRSSEDYEYFLFRFDKYFNKYFESYAYCLIPNHFHFLIKVSDINKQSVKDENTSAGNKYLQNLVPYNTFLENQLSRFLSGYALWYNKKYDRSGPLLKDGTKRVLVKSEAKLVQLLCYIHHNPIHHKLSNRFGKWKYCSYQGYVLEVETKLKKTEMLKYLGGASEFDRVHLEFLIENRIT